MTTAHAVIFFKHKAWAEKLAQKYSHARKIFHTDAAIADNAALFGLLQACESWDESRGVPFRVFAKKRILGEILDSARAQDLIPRREYWLKSDRKLPLVNSLELPDMKAQTEFLVRKFSSDLEQYEISDLVTLIIKALDSRKLTIITLHFFEDKNMSEIAKILDLSVNYVCSLKNQALQELREKIEEYDQD